jgi:IclR family acetate operon transcriptional repressor
LLTEFVKAGLVRPTTNPGRYALSLEFLRLAYLTIANVPIRQIAMPYMRRLTDACNETSLLGLYDNARQEMMFVAMVDSSHPLRYSIELNKWLPVHVGASGLGIMAFLPDEEISLIIKRTRLAPATPKSIIQPAKMEAEIEKIRERGYALTHGHRTPDAVGFGAPIYGNSGEVIGDICVTLPESRFDPKSEKRIAEHMLTCAKQITAAIGGTPARK